MADIVGLLDKRVVDISAGIYLGRRLNQRRRLFFFSCWLPPTYLVVENGEFLFLLCISHSLPLCDDHQSRYQAQQS